MKNFFKLLWIATGAIAIISAYNERRKTAHSAEQENGQDLQERLAACGFRVTTTALGNGDQYIRFRGSHEALMNLVEPDRIDDKPPLPADLDINALPKYFGGCPHCGKMSLFGENQWRYQELSRTREQWDNTTTFLVKCQNCKGFMKSTVDHND